MHANQLGESSGCHDEMRMNTPATAKISREEGMQPVSPGKSSGILKSCSSAMNQNKSWQTSNYLVTG